MDKRQKKDRQNAWAIAARDRGDRTAAGHLIDDFKGMIIQHAAIAARAFRLPREDFKSEGAVGVLRAIRAYDEARGDFSPCAFLYIRDSINDYGRKNWSDFKIPQSKDEREMHAKLSGMVFNYEGQGWSNQMAIELSAREIGVDPARAANAMALKSGKVAISTDCEDDENTSGANIISDEKNGEEDLQEISVRRVISECLLTLSDRERHVIEHCLLGAEDMTFAQYAEKFGGARQTAGKHAFNGKAKMVNYFKARGFSLDDLLEL